MSLEDQEPEVTFLDSETYYTENVWVYIGKMVFSNWS